MKDCKLISNSRDETFILQVSDNICILSSVKICIAWLELTRAKPESTTSRIEIESVIQNFILKQKKAATTDLVNNRTLLLYTLRTTE